LRIAITGGGTGGHLAIAKALDEAFQNMGVQTIYIGSTKGQDMEWFAKEGNFCRRHFLASTGVVDKRGLGKFKAFGQILVSAKEAAAYLEGCEAVVSVGGYSAAPASFAALAKRVPLFIHEQNAHIGRLNRLLKPFAKDFFSSFFPPYYPYPVDPQYYRNRRIRKKLQTIIFLGGSQGARQINDLALSWAKELDGAGVHIVHQTGRGDYERVKREYERLGVEAEVFDFSFELISKIAKADLAVARSGAGTLWELATNLLPAIYLPYPHAANDHQRKNASFLAKRKASLLFDNHTVYDILEMDLQSMSRTLQKFSQPNGAQRIARAILERI